MTPCSSARRSVLESFRILVVLLVCLAASHHHLRAVASESDREIYNVIRTSLNATIRKKYFMGNIHGFCVKRPLE